ncbi:hypothetical protein [Rhodoferax sp.]|uniref:hypothetical protein n=1 Tax=Rhodoferax sp. TaxID=50421 RepID=UPI0025DBAC2D|nr:hypothetical protein [Rhodoferax sp.]
MTASTTAGAGAASGAGASSFLPQATKAAAAITTAKTSDLFILKLPNKLTKQFPEIVNAEKLQGPSKNDSSSFYSAKYYILKPIIAKPVRRYCRPT